MHRVLLRALIMVYKSDKYDFLDDVEITGFFNYYDLSYGTMRRKDVVNFHMSRTEYMQIDFEKVDVETLFSTRLKPKESTGLYTKKAEEISDIYTAKEKILLTRRPGSNKSTIRRKKCFYTLRHYASIIH